MTPGQFTQNWDWDIPIPIRYGPGRVREVGDICASRGIRNPLVVTDRASASLPFVGAVMGALEGAGLRCALFSDVSPNPKDIEAGHGAEAFRQGDHDAVIALGGGSGMDAGKAVSLLARSNHPLWDFDFDVAPPNELTKADFPPLLCIPTTAGTGAETESTGMITDTSRGIKGCVWHPAQKPIVAILDPELTIGLPPRLTAWTGCDALTHAIEAYCVPAAHPICDGVALEGLRLVAKALPEVLKAPTSIEARGAMLVGSCLAGISFLKGLGMVHAISHMVGAEFDTHHGLTNAVLLPPVLRFNAKDIESKVGPMCEAMGQDGSDFGTFLAGVEHLLDLCAIPQGLEDLGVCQEAIGSLALKASRDPAAATNPRRASVPEIEELIQSAMTTTRAERGS